MDPYEQQQHEHAEKVLFTFTHVVYCCSRMSQGCGIVRFATPAAAAAAKASLHSKHKWNEEATAMVVEWVNEDKTRNACVKDGKFPDSLACKGLHQ